jgi:hypothetical protein
MTDADWEDVRKQWAKRDQRHQKLMSKINEALDKKNEQLLKSAERFAERIERKRMTDRLIELSKSLDDEFDDEE